MTRQTSQAHVHNQPKSSLNTQHGSLKRSNSHQMGKENRAQASKPSVSQNIPTLAKQQQHAWSTNSLLSSSTSATSTSSSASFTPSYSLFALKRPSLGKLLQSQKSAHLVYASMFSIGLIKPWESLEMDTAASSSTFMRQANQMIGERDCFVIELSQQQSPNDRTQITTKYICFVTERAVHITRNWPRDFVSVYYCTGKGIISPETHREIEDAGLWRHERGNHSHILIPIPMLHAVHDPLKMPSKEQMMELGMVLHVMNTHLHDRKLRLLRDVQSQQGRSVLSGGASCTGGGDDSSSASLSSTSRARSSRHRIIWDNQRIRASVKRLKLHRKLLQDESGTDEKAHVYSREFVEANMRGEKFRFKGEGILGKGGRTGGNHSRWDGRR
mmetsp:Transcript_7678/g.28794  ORF Transcript_7678/g.28794 Transcript_7678/m.28794 type:complete len:386 (-) Transcript_7678:183-1340(-)